MSKVDERQDVASTLEIGGAAEEGAEALSSWFAEVHAGLSRAKGAAEILEATLGYLRRRQPSGVALHYLPFAEEGRGAELYVAAQWRREVEASTAMALDERSPFAESMAALRQAAPEPEVLLLSQLADSPLLPAGLRSALAARGVASLAILPLYSGSSSTCHGLLTIEWSLPHTFSAVESQVYKALSHSIAAFIAGQRFQHVQVEALAEMRTLYDVGTRLNLATSMHEILSVLAAPIAGTAAEHARLYAVLHDADGKITELMLCAEWGTPVTRRTLGERRPPNDLDEIWLNAADIPLIMDDMEHEGRLGHEQLARIVESGVRAMVFLPLRVKSRFVGLASLLWRRPYRFSGQERRLFAGVMRQAAVALDNRLLMEQAQDALQERLNMQGELIKVQAAALAERSTPVIPLSDRVLIVPIIGSIDTERAAQIMDLLLTHIGRSGASVALIDITGVPAVDSQAASGLLKTAQAVRLLGAEVVLTGIRAEVAQTLVRLGLDLKGIVTCRTLQAGIAYAQARWGKNS